MKYFKDSSSFRGLPDLYYKYDEDSLNKDVYRYINGKWVSLTLWHWEDCDRKFMFEVTEEEMFLELV